MLEIKSKIILHQDDVTNCILVKVKIPPLVESATNAYLHYGALKETKWS